MAAEQYDHPFTANPLQVPELLQDPLKVRKRSISVREIGQAMSVEKVRILYWKPFYMQDDCHV